MGTIAVFLDRDGVLVRDSGPLTHIDEARLMAEAPLALAKLKQSGALLIVVSNQTVVARGLLGEEGVWALHAQIEARLVERGSPKLDGFYFCGHHPSADLPAYRVRCGCRKPGIDLLLRAQAEHRIDLARSFLVGDRFSDIAAGQRAGCRTVLVRSGRHCDPPIETDAPFDLAVPNCICDHLGEAADFILRSM